MEEPSNAQKIIAGDINGQTDKLSLPEFKNLYREIQLTAERQSIQTPKADILLLSEQAIIKFESAPKLIIHIDEKRPLKKSDFEIVVSPKFYGNLKPIPIRGFIWTEIKKNGFWLGIIFIGFLLLLSYDSNNSNLETISQMLVEANALFVGIFTLFTITQNRDLFASKTLISRGWTHQMMQNDYYMTSLSIISLVLAFVTVPLISTPFDVIILSQWKFEVTSARLIGVIALVLLIDCLLSVTQYYLKAMHRSVEGKMYKEIMGSEKDE